jgi:hypothetical protein
MLRIANLGISGWDIWAEQDQPSIVDTLKSSWQSLVFDLSRFERPSSVRWSRWRPYVTSGVNENHGNQFSSSLMKLTMCAPPSQWTLSRQP